MSLPLLAGQVHTGERALGMGEVSGSSPEIGTTSRPLRRAPWGHSSVGRAAALQADGRRFDSCCLHHPRTHSSSAAERLVHTQRAGGSSPSCATIVTRIRLEWHQHGLIPRTPMFNSWIRNHHARVAQRQERLPHKQRVRGSSPCVRTTSWIGRLTEQDTGHSTRTMRVQVPSDLPPLRPRSSTDRAPAS